MKKIRMTESEFHENVEDNMGFCVACGGSQCSCEPDARNYECEECGQRKVFGTEELLLMGQLIIIGE